eukprot:1291077-Rhodomonas_salina.2
MGRGSEQHVLSGEAEEQAEGRSTERHWWRHSQCQDGAAHRARGFADMEAHHVLSGEDGSR